MLLRLCLFSVFGRLYCVRLVSFAVLLQSTRVRDNSIGEKCLRGIFFLGKITMVANCANFTHVFEFSLSFLMGWNCIISTHQVHGHKSLSYELRSQCASEQANERSRARERSEQCRASKWVSVASERAWAIGRIKWPRTPHVDFTSILPNVHFLYPNRHFNPR